jgi:ribonuclease HII
MSLDLKKMSVEDLRRRFLSDSVPISGQALAKLRKDPRQAARSLCRLLEKRRREQHREKTRVQSLLYFEGLLWNSGIERIAGVDEVGIGPLAGPVVAAAVIFPRQVFLEGIDDSKKLDAAQRSGLRQGILEVCLAHAIAVVEPDEVDALNVYRAGLEAMRRAVAALSPQPQHVLVDAREIPGLDTPQNRFDKGDGINFSIAAASILAKTHRDALMDQYHQQYPEYGFDRHKGYSTAAHQKALRDHGPCPLHRRSFPFVREVCGKFSASFYLHKDALIRAGTREELLAADERLLPLQGDLTEYEWRKLRMCSQRAWSRVAAKGKEPRIRPALSLK